MFRSCVVVQMVGGLVKHTEKIKKLVKVPFRLPAIMPMP